MKKIMMAVAAIVGLGLGAHAGDTIDFDGKGIGSISFMEMVKKTDSCQNDNMGCAMMKTAPIPYDILNAVQLPDISDQPLIKNIVAAYNTQVLHDQDVENNLKVEGVLVAFELPRKVLITKNGEVLNTIANGALIETIRYNLTGSYDANKGLTGKCLKWVLNTILTEVAGHYIEKVIKTCEEYEPAPDPKPSHESNDTWHNNHDGSNSNYEVNKIVKM